MTLESNENFYCPYCGQSNELLVDFTGGNNQRFVLDCETCCAPISIRLKIRGQNILEIDIRKENE